MENENKSLWMLKGIACIVVILFHCPISGIVGDAIIYAVRFPIPVFLMISGYYGFRKKNYLKYAKKTLLLIITGEVISAIVMEVCFKLGLLKINPFQILANINWIKTIFFGSIFIRKVFSWVADAQILYYSIINHAYSWKNAGNEIWKHSKSDILVPKYNFICYSVFNDWYVDCGAYGKN